MRRINDGNWMASMTLQQYKVKESSVYIALEREYPIPPFLAVVRIVPIVPFFKEEWTTLVLNMSAHTLFYSFTKLYNKCNIDDTSCIRHSRGALSKRDLSKKKVKFAKPWMRELKPSWNWKDMKLMRKYHLTSILNCFDIFYLFFSH